MYNVYYDCAATRSNEIICYSENISLVYSGYYWMLYKLLHMYYTSWWARTYTKLINIVFNNLLHPKSSHDPPQAHLDTIVSLVKSIITSSPAHSGTEPWELLHFFIFSASVTSLSHTHHDSPNLRSRASGSRAGPMVHARICLHCAWISRPRGTIPPQLCARRAADARRSSRHQGSRGRAAQCRGDLCRPQGKGLLARPLRWGRVESWGWWYLWGLLVRWYPRYGIFLLPRDMYRLSSDWPFDC